VLEQIPGIGEKRKRSLLSHFGSLKRIRSATADEIAQVEGFNAQLADRVQRFLAAEERAVLEAEAREAAQGAADVGEGPPPDGEAPVAADREDVAFDAAAAELEAIEEQELGEPEPVEPEAEREVETQRP
jgi:excinuclease ABC subunit C